jgi:cell division protein DivIC
MSRFPVIPTILKNKYMITAAIFATWMIFFDHNDFFLQRARASELSDLEESKAYYRDQIEKTRKELNNIEGNPLSLEKIAREKYLMKKDNEDLFIIAEK